MSEIIEQDLGLSLTFIKEFLSEQEEIYIRKIGEKDTDTIEQMYDYVWDKCKESDMGITDFTAEHLKEVIKVIADPIYNINGKNQLHCFDALSGLCVPIDEMMSRILDHECFHELAFEVSQLNSEDYRKFRADVLNFDTTVYTVNDTYDYIPLKKRAFHILSKTMVPYSELNQRGIGFTKKIDVEPINLRPTEISETLRMTLSGNREALQKIRRELCACRSEDSVADLGRALLLACMQAS